MFSLVHFDNVYIHVKTRYRTFSSPQKVSPYSFPVNPLPFPFLISIIICEFPLFLNLM